jgi:pheromone a factor receptor
VPYTTWLFVVLCRTVVDPYSWSHVHDPQRHNTIMKAPSFSQVTVDRWGEVATGYILFFVFGTGSDAYNTYKKMLQAIGLGTVFPSLYVMRESRSSTPNSFIVARTWKSNISSKARSMFWSRADSVAVTLHDTTRNSSVTLGSMQRLRSHTTETPVIERQSSSSPSFFARISGCETLQQPVLPRFEHRSRSLAETFETDIHKSKTQEQSPGASAYAWGTDMSDSERASEGGGVRVVLEVHLYCQEFDGYGKGKKPNE